jgi:hypothetical protein
MTRIPALLTAAIALLLNAPRLHSEDNSVIEQRMADSVKLLASDELEGRGIGLPGLDKAADYIAGEFARIGLKTDLYDGTAFQKFTMSTGSRRGERNSLAFVAPDGTTTELKLDESFTPLAIGGDGKFDVPLVFAGYGITGKDEQYDDFAGIDVKGKGVILLRHEPQQGNPHSIFNGDKHSAHAPFTRKVSNAYEHGAAAVLFVSDEFDIQKSVAQFERRWQTAIDELAEAQAKFKQLEEPSDDMRSKHRETIARLTTEIQKWQQRIVDAEDPILKFQDAGESGEKREMPVFYCRRSVIDRIVKAALGKDLAVIEREIDKSFHPQSAALAGWKVRGEADVITTRADVKNVVAVLEGEGPTAEETIVIGAHYDHWGRGGSGSAAPGSTEIHNGADDNASGVTALLEIAGELKACGKLPRRIVFVAFTGEEEGLIGSSRYVREPLFPLDKTVAMLNLDMVGRLNEEKLIVYGTGTADTFDALAERLAKDGGFKLSKQPEGFGPSDHSSFYAKQIPVLHFFTGTHSDYHRPSDDVEKLNIPGMRRIAQAVTAAAISIATAPERPKYVEVKSNQFAGGGGDRPYFGSIPDFAQDQPGYALMGVTKGSPAEKAGLKAGDIIVQFGESKIGNLSDFDSALRKFKAGDKVTVLARRGNEEVKLEVVLDPPK